MHRSDSEMHLTKGTNHSCGLKLLQCKFKISVFKAVDRNEEVGPSLLDSENLTLLRSSSAKAALCSISRVHKEVMAE